MKRVNYLIIEKIVDNIANINLFNKEKIKFYQKKKLFSRQKKKEFKIRKRIYYWNTI